MVELVLGKVILIQLGQLLELMVLLLELVLGFHYYKAFVFHKTVAFVLTEDLFACAIFPTPCNLVGGFLYAFLSCFAFCQRLPLLKDVDKTV